MNKDKGRLYYTLKETEGYMPEIKVNHSNINKSLEKLKHRTKNIPTDHTNVKFSISTLHFLEKITSIEETYYRALEEYKKSLLNIEEKIQTKVKKD